MQVDYKRERRKLTLSKSGTFELLVFLSESVIRGYIKRALLYSDKTHRELAGSTLLERKNMDVGWARSWDGLAALSLCSTCCGVLHDRKWRAMFATKRTPVE